MGLSAQLVKGLSTRVRDKKLGVKRDLCARVTSEISPYDLALVQILHERIMKDVGLASDLVVSNQSKLPFCVEVILY